MKNILLLTDFSENSWNAIAYALQFLENAHCNFYVLHVLNGVAETEAKAQFQELHTRISETFPVNPLHNFYTLLDRKAWND